ncbi:MAG: hypothetical protein WCI21_08080 [Alphaproteobacteria bacterium]
MLLSYDWLKSLVPLTVSDVSGKPLRDNLEPASLWRVAGLVETANAWRWTAFLALAVTLAATDPLNLSGILVPGPRIPALRRRSIRVVDGAILDAG